MKRTIHIAVLGALSAFVYAEPTIETQKLEPIIVTAAPQKKAGVVQFNTKTAIQPLPASDGAGLLKSVSNMSIIRKGGSSGDPLFRGLGGSRLAIQADEQFIYGGCGGRMDPPTAYIFPTIYDKVIVTKGPQTVTQGMGLVTGSVRFVRKNPQFTDKKTNLNAAYTLGSFGRHDLMADGSIGNDLGYARFSATYNKSDDYKDGDGNRVHSAFERNSQMLQLGITPTTNTDIASTYERSRGEAAYADRMMDGSKFDRDAWNIRATQRNLTDWWTETELRYGRSEVDHVMDNFSLRSATMDKRLGNPKRETDTAHFKNTFDFGNVNLQAGIDYMRDKHSARRGVNYKEKAYEPSQNFKQWGGFAEANWQRTDTQNLIAGYRHDQVTAVYDYPEYKTDEEFSLLREQKYKLDSGFIRLEQKVGKTKYYAGIGIAERSPDFWEREAADTLKPERNNQIDVGAIWKSEKLEGSISLFGSKINDFILKGKNRTRNIDATRYGGEAELTYRFLPDWNVSSSLAYTHGKNKTDNKSLAQTPPLEWKTSLNWDNGKYSAGALWRVVAKQNRYHTGYGNIASLDIGESAGFGVLSLNAGWRVNKQMTVQAGVDNVFNKTYSEFVSKGGHPSAGLRTTRVNEPARQVWLRLQAQF
ncbi:TonB-dependent copper receptor [Kingella negevensis]|uniref:Vitamin B12 transporter BtuB n=1 Tax=Kingella negevensis TaxID=1522312 RepID=A0A238TCN0_9NEIS|nr:TonB-dependent copper receptor [Kingella negevensis]MDK4684918.1 TonB-dependent copper receptor [Kingella negevensis]MDK4698099.1 TonB-dependent copper receptor [Kingella negevensis]SNB62757.1 Vitamin B12 transporter BtuB [Kingella negevensis]